MKYLFTLLLGAICLVAFGQKRRMNPTLAQKATDRASVFIAQQDFDKAIEQLAEAVYFDSTMITPYQQLGDIYRKLGKYGLARKNYEKVLSIDPNFLPLTYFGIAESEMNTGDYAKAIEHFRKYLTYPILEAGKKLCAKYLADCEFSIKAVGNPVIFNPVNMGPAINTADDEYFPSVTADGEKMIFTRRTKEGENFYVSNKKNNRWTNAVYLSDTLNTEYNEGAQCISQDGVYLFFTGCNRHDGKGRCDIYLSKWENGGWSEPFNIGEPVNTRAWESQPSLSASGRTLYFASNRPGGMGGYDIWKSDLKDDGSWAEPVNLGPNINTTYDEQAPFIHPDDQTLYFSSNGWPGLGKKDLFTSRLDDHKQWTKPVNMGYPINTFQEENGLTISRDGKTAYYSVERDDSFGKVDIYSFDLPEASRPKPVTYVRGIIIDQDSQKPLNVKVQIKDLATRKPVFDDSTDPETGAFLATMPIGGAYGLSISKEGYLLHSENFMLKDEQMSQPFSITLTLQKIGLGKKEVLKNIFFDTNEYVLLQESKIELDDLIDFLSENTGLEIEMQGHTDNVGSDSANQILSENRAKSVYTYLIENGVNSARLSFKGYGASSPIADNDTEAGRKLNRRTEFKITKK